MLVKFASADPGLHIEYEYEYEYDAYLSVHIQVHLNKLECREKVLSQFFFLVTYFKKWNFHIF